MNERLKDFFYFSRGEKNGIIVLLSLLLLLIAAPYFILLFAENKPQVNKEFEKEIELFTQSLQEIEEPEYNTRLNQYIIERYDSLRLFYFNPNTTSKENFKRLGLTGKQINTVFNYINKGGKFYIKDDFRKIYGIRHQQYQILKPYILLPNQNKSGPIYNSEQKKTDNQTDSFFVFNPNNATDKEFQKLGFSEKQTNTIRNYLNKGGIFNSKEDFKKIYGISQKQYNQLEPYIFLQPKKNLKTNANYKLVELNTATLSELTEIKGIGNHTANAIIKYKKNLGGFVDIHQLLEIKTIKEESFNSYKNRLNINAENIKKISLNFAEVEDLVAHPYINYYQAKEIVKFRSANGPYQNKKQLLENKILLKHTYKKIEPYLNLN